MLALQESLVEKSSSEQPRVTVITVYIEATLDQKPKIKSQPLDDIFTEMKGKEKYLGFVVSYRRHLQGYEWLPIFVIESMNFIWYASIVR